jgi:hypothetical protein
VWFGVLGTVVDNATRQNGTARVIFAGNFIGTILQKN